MKRSLALLSLAIVILSFAAGCQDQAAPVATSAPTFTTVSRLEPTFTSLPPTATATPTPLPPTVAATNTLEPTVPPSTETVTPAPTSTPWRIWFKGVKCEDPKQSCGADEEGIVYHHKYYSILSNGEDLQELTVSQLPSTPMAPAGAVEVTEFDKNGSPHLSPDGLRMVYVGKDENLYLANLTDGRTVLLYQPSEALSSISIACWDGAKESIRFIVSTLKEWNTPDNTLYRVNPDGSDLEVIISLGEDAVGLNGNCSPDGQYVAFPIQAHYPDRVGLYIFDLNSGELRHVLSGYAIWEVQNAPIAEQP